MSSYRRLALLLAATALTACATTDRDPPRPTSNPVAGAAAASSAGARAIGAYGAVGTSDDVRGRTSSSGSSVLTGRANLSGGDAGTQADTNDDDAAPPKPPRR